MKMPDFANNSLPPEEREDAGFLNWLCYSLDLYARRFEDSVSLIDQIDHGRSRLLSEFSAEASRVSSDRDSVPADEWDSVSELSDRATQAHRWCEVAARDAVFSVYHFEYVIDAIATAVEQTCPSLRPHIELGRIREAATTFDNRFPTIDIVRNALGHSGEAGSSRTKAMRNSLILKDGEPINAFHGSLAWGGRTIIATSEVRGEQRGRSGRLHVTRETAELIRGFQEEVYASLKLGVDFSQSLPKPLKPSAAAP